VIEVDVKSIVFGVQTGAGFEIFKVGAGLMATVSLPCMNLVVHPFAAALT
jgi:hypothetical protein